MHAGNPEHRFLGSGPDVAPNVPDPALSVVNPDRISQKVFIKSFCRSQLLHKSVNVSFTRTNIKKKVDRFVWELTFAETTLNTLCEMRPGPASLDPDRPDRIEDSALPCLSSEAVVLMHMPKYTKVNSGEHLP